MKKMITILATMLFVFVATAETIYLNDTVLPSYTFEYGNTYIIKYPIEIGEVTFNTGYFTDKTTLHFKGGSFGMTVGKKLTQYGNGQVKINTAIVKKDANVIAPTLKNFRFESDYSTITVLNTGVNDSNSIADENAYTSTEGNKRYSSLIKADTNNFWIKHSGESPIIIKYKRNNTNEQFKRVSWNNIQTPNNSNSLYFIQRGMVHDDNSYEYFTTSYTVHGDYNTVNDTTHTVWVKYDTDDLSKSYKYLTVNKKRYGCFSNISFVNDTLYVLSYKQTIQNVSDTVFILKYSGLVNNKYKFVSGTKLTDFNTFKSKLNPDFSQYFTFQTFANLFSGTYNKSIISINRDKIYKYDFMSGMRNLFLMITIDKDKLFFRDCKLQGDFNYSTNYWIRNEFYQVQTNKVCDMAFAFKRNYTTSNAAGDFTSKVFLIRNDSLIVTDKSQHILPKTFDCTNAPVTNNLKLSNDYSINTQFNEYGFSRYANLILNEDDIFGSFFMESGELYCLIKEGLNSDNKSLRYAFKKGLIFNVNGYGVVARNPKLQFSVSNSLFKNADINIYNSITNSTLINVYNLPYSTISKRDSIRMCNIIKPAYTPDYTDKLYNNVIGDNTMFRDTIDYKLKDTTSMAYNFKIKFAAYDNQFQYDAFGNLRKYGVRFDAGWHEYSPNQNYIDEQSNTVKNFEVKAYPNPFNNSTTIKFNNLNPAYTGKVKLYNIKGELIKTFDIQPELNINMNNCASGVYVLKVDDLNYLKLHLTK